MKENILYHNPRCSKSRKALEILNENGIDFEIKEYLKVGLKKEEIKSLLKKLNIKPLEGLIRIKEKVLEENNIDLISLSDAQLIDTIVEFPVLLERPIFIKSNKAIIGRPPENILELI